MIRTTSCRRFRMVSSVAAFCLVAGTTAGVPAAQPAATAVRIAHDDENVTVSAGGRPLLVYRFGGVPGKPYVKELYTPSGVQVLRDSPADHKHHHALMFAVGIDGVDFWSENDRCGRQVHRSLEGVTSTAKDGTARAGFTEKLDWVAPGAERPLATETRTIGVWRAADVPASVVTWETRLEPAAGRESVTLGGSHYFGLGMRLVKSMDSGPRLFNADKNEGEPVRGQERLTRTRWFALTATAGGGPVTVAMFDDPRNPRHPARFFTMPAPFAYISATLNYWKDPLEVKAGRPLVLRYAVAAWDGQVKPEEVEKLYQRCVSGKKPE